MKCRSIAFSLIHGMAQVSGLRAVMTCNTRAILCLDDDDDDTQRVVGKLRLFYIDIDSAAEAGENLFDLFDIDGAAEPFYSTLFDARTEDYKQSVYKLVGNEIWGRNLLILDRLEIIPEFRGHNLGFGARFFGR